MKDTFSHYTIVRELGRGGMATVYHATDTVDQKPVALKMLFPHLASDIVTRTRFLREAKAGTTLNHPGIVKVFEVGEEDGQPFIAMEFVEGKTLEETMETETLALETIISIGAKVADALAAAHANGVIHRDIKPRNIMLTNGEVKMMDFGLVRMLDTPTITQKYEVVGTLHYMSPQQAIGAEIDARTDLFSLGVVLYHLLTGSLPFSGNHPGAIIHSILHSDPLRMEELRKGIPAELEQVVFKALQKEPQDRYQSATELKFDLENVKKSLQGETITLIATEEVFEEQPRSVQSALAGREKELDVLDGYLHEMLRGTGSIVLISGEAGIGKSRLVWELGRKAKDYGFRYISGRCFFGEEGFPYQPILEVIRGYLELRGVKDTRALHDFLGTRAPYLAERENVIKTLLLVGHTGTSLINKEQVWDTVAELIRTMAQDKPLLLHMDDLHWGDSPTLNLLAYLAMRVRTERVLIVGTYRPEELTQEPESHPLASLMRRLKKEDLCKQINLERLDLEATRNVITSVFPGSDLPDDFIQTVFEETEGNPLFVVEVLTLLQKDGSIAPDNGGWSLVREVDRKKIPGRISEVIMNRFSTLSQQERTLVEVASVEGRSFHSDTICSCLGLPRVKVLVALRDLEQSHHLVYASEREYHFDHVKIRDVVYSSLTPELKQQYHRCIGNYLIGDFADEDEYAGKIAHHLASSGRPDEAIPYLVRAGDHAAQLFANEDAIRHFETANDLIDTELTKERNSETLATKLNCVKKMADVLRLTASYDDAIFRYGEAIGLAEEISDEKERAASLYGLAVATANTGGYDAALEHLKQALAVYRKLNDLAGMGDTVRSIGNVGYWSGQYDDALKYYTESLEIQKKAKNRRGQCGAYNNMGNVHYDRGEYDKAIVFFEKALAIARETHYRFAEGNALNNLANVHADRGDFDQALDYYQQSLVIQKQVGNRLGEGDVLNNIAQVCQDRGDYGQALECQNQALTTYRLIGRTEGEWELMHRRSRLWLQLGDEKKGKETLNEARRIAESIGTPHGDLWYQLDGAFARHLSGSYKDALLQVMEGVAAAREMSEVHGIVEGLALAARASEAGGDDRAALRHAEELLRFAEERDRKNDVARAALILGRINLKVGELDVAEQQLARAIEMAEECGAKEIIWRGRHARGKIFTERGDAPGAADEFGKAGEAVNQILSGLSEDLRKLYLRKKAVTELHKDLKATGQNE